MRKSFTPTPKKQKYEFQVNKRKFLVRGFTLIELILVISISILLVGLVLIDYRSSQKRRNLDLAAEEIRSMIVKAYDMSLSPEDSGVGGYGVHFDQANRQYTLFKDANKNHQYDSGEAIGQPGTLPPEVSINNYLVNNNPYSGILPSPFFSDLVFDVPAYNDEIPYKKDTFFSGQQEGTDLPTIGTLSNISVILQYGTSQKKINTNLYTNTVNITN